MGKQLWTCKSDHSAKFWRWKVLSETGALIARVYGATETEARLNAEKIAKAGTL